MSDNFAHVGDELVLMIFSAPDKVRAVISMGVTWTRIDETGSGSRWRGTATAAGKVEPTVVLDDTECPTNHTDNHQGQSQKWADVYWEREPHIYAFCPDCGSSLAPKDVTP